MSQARPEPPARSPRPGSLEWLADAQGESLAVLDGATGRALTRAEHDAAANGLACGLHDEHGLDAGARVAVRLAPGGVALTVLYALAKLGAAPLLLSPETPREQAATLAATAGCALLITDGAPTTPRSPGGGGVPELVASALSSLRDRHADGPRRLSGEQPAADSVQATDPAGGALRLVLRARDPERVARLAATVGDLLSRVALPPQGLHLLGPAADRPEPQFWAAVALVTGGTVLTPADPSPLGLLRALGEHAVTSAVLPLATLRQLVALPQDVREEADLLDLQRVITYGPASPDAALADACADLLGEDVLHHVSASTPTGPYAHAAAAHPPTPLAGVTLEDGGLRVRSPLNADGALGGPAERRGWPRPPAWRDMAVPAVD
ncbi:MAG: hypothetical protein JWM31_3552 [Solirubrobacterales bacterium]|nr:hypothetical protein [Solirubrobacterales bacterium]